MALLTILISQVCFSMDVPELANHEIESAETLQSDLNKLKIRLNNTKKQSENFLGALYYEVEEAHKNLEDAKKNIASVDLAQVIKSFNSSKAIFFTHIANIHHFCPENSLDIILSEKFQLLKSQTIKEETFFNDINFTSSILQQILSSKSHLEKVLCKITKDINIRISTINYITESLNQNKIQTEVHKNSEQNSVLWAKAQLNRAEDFLQQKNYAKAFEILSLLNETKIKAKIKNCIRMNLGNMYLLGNYVEVDLITAKRFYTIVLEERVSDKEIFLSAYNNLGCISELIKDYNTAFKYYEHASNLGSVFAHLNLAYLYENGLGVARDAQKARNLKELGLECRAEWAQAKRSLDRVLRKLR